MHALCTTEPDEQYCYARGRLVFDYVTDIKRISRSAQQCTDTTVEVDLGNIDSLVFEPGNYIAEGDWGQVQIRSASEPQFAFD